MKKILFATTNQGKLDEAKRALEVEVEGLGLEIEEVQSLDTEKVAVAKAKAYFAEVKKPLFVEDVALAFEVWNGLPGTYINDFWKAWGNSGLIARMSSETNRKATAKTTLAYADEQGEIHVFEGIMEGKIATEERGDNGFGWDPIFIPDGFEKTLAEMSAEEKDSVSMRAKALAEMHEWLKKN